VFVIGFLSDSFVLLLIEVGVICHAAETMVAVVDLEGLRGVRSGQLVLHAHAVLRVRDIVLAELRLVFAVAEVVVEDRIHWAVNNLDVFEIRLNQSLQLFDDLLLR
jgi:hypothetical protein